MIDFSQYEPMTVIHVCCNDSLPGMVVIQSESCEDRFILVRRHGCVAKLSSCGDVIDILGDTGLKQKKHGYSVLKIIAVLGVASTTVIREADEGNDEPRFVVLSSNSIPKFGHTLDSGICLAEKMVESERETKVYVAKIVKVVQSMPVAVTSDWEPEVVQ